MKISPQASAKSAFLKVYNEAFDNTLVVSKQDPERLYFLRCSQIPYCPGAVLLNYAIRGKHFAMDMGMAYYVSVGHAVHDVMQKYLSQSGKFLADYHCRECNKRYPLSHTYECCGFPTDYHEVSIDYKGVKGHIDGIVKIKNDYYIVDYKTLSLQTREQKSRKPPKNYVRQITAYAYLLWKQHNIKVAGVMLVFIPRDNPRKPAIWEFRLKDSDFSDIRKSIVMDLNLHRKTMLARTIEEMTPLLKVNCGTDYCNACKMSVKEKINRLKPRLSKFPIKATNKQT